MSLMEVAVVVIELLHLVALRHQYVYVIVGPGRGRQILQEQQRVLELHAFELL